MILKFIKDHPIGIPNGTVKNIDNKLAEGDSKEVKSRKDEIKEALKL